MMSSSLAQTVTALVRNGQFLVGLHASERLDERGILEWQVIEAMEHAQFLAERADGPANPVVEFAIVLPDGTPAKAVWAYLRRSQVAKLVTVHYL